MRSRVHEGLPFVCSGLSGLAQTRDIVGRQWRRNAELDLVPAVREKICGSGLNTWAKLFSVIPGRMEPKMETSGEGFCFSTSEASKAQDEISFKG